MKGTAITVLVGIVLAGVVIGASELAEIEKRLLSTRVAIKQSEREAKQSNKDLLAFRDRVVYSNDTLKEIYLEMKALEKELILKREDLDNKIMKMPEYRDLVKKRKDAYQAVRELKGEEQHILRAIESAKMRAGGAE